MMVVHSSTNPLAPNLSANYITQLVLNDRLKEFQQQSTILLCRCLLNFQLLYQPKCLQLVLISLARPD